MSAPDPNHGGRAGEQRVRIILHPKAALNEALRDAVRRLRAEGHTLEVRVTWEPTDAEDFARQATEGDGLTTLVAGGGDGTLNAVVSGLLKSGKTRCPSLGLIPLGTANDFARGSRIPLGDPYAALRVVIDRPAVPVDVGRCGDRYFINVATGGFGTQVTANTAPELKEALGGAAYLLTGLSQLQNVSAQEARFRGDGFHWAGRFLAAAVGNGRFAGGGVDLCPEARLDDGLLELIIMPELPPSASVPDALADLLREGFGAIQRNGVRARLPWLEIDASESLQINLDGEPIETERVRFDVLAGAVRFHLPEGCPLLSPN